MRSFLALLVTLILVSACTPAAVSTPTPTDTQQPAVTEPPPTETTAPTQEPLPAEIDPEALLQDRCTRCHNLDRVVQAQKSLDAWTTTVDGMIQRGAELNAEEREALIEFLALTYPEGPMSAEIDALALLQTRCTVCHNLNRVKNEDGTAAEWASTVDNMISRGAVLNAEERDALIDYLALTYPD